MQASFFQSNAMLKHLSLVCALSLSGTFNQGLAEKTSAQKKMAGAFVKKRHLKKTKLNLSHQHIGDEKAIALTKSLKNQKSPVFYLNLTCNQIGDAGAKALAAVLPKSQLKELYLDGNQIGKAGSKALFDALPKSKLKKLVAPYGRCCL